MAELTKLKKRVWVEPCVDCGCCGDTEEDAYRITYEIPGVEKDKIHLKVTKKALRLTAHRDDFDYVSEYVFACDADAEAVNASYDNGLLAIEVPFDCPDPFKEARQVTIG